MTIVNDQSLRLARNKFDSAHYKRILKNNGVRVVSATEVILIGPEGILLESMLEGMAEYYSADLSKRSCADRPKTH